VPFLYLRCTDKKVFTFYVPSKKYSSTKNNNSYNVNA
jgi:hypothetical protein